MVRSTEAAHAEGLRRCACSETYQYYDLPFCQPPEGLTHKPETLGEVSGLFPLPGMPAFCTCCCYKKDLSLSTLSCISGSSGTSLKSCPSLQVVDGNRLIVTPYDLSFQKEHEHTSLCKRKFGTKEIQHFRKVCS